MEVASVQRRTLRLLFVTQIIGGIGVAIGASVGALLAADIAGIGVSGVAQSAFVVGAALFALPATAVVLRRGRRPSLAAGYFVAAVGSIFVVIAAVRGSIPLLFVGFFLFGGATAAGLQARYAAVDLAAAGVRGRHLSVIVWATTLGAVAGPNLAAFAGASRGVGAGTRAALRAVVSRASARLGVSAMAVGHLVMVGVMAMTPVHIRGAGHDAAHTLRVVGVVLSFHIAGMYAFSPVFGWLTDRLGRRPVIVIAIALLLTACF